MSPKQTWYDLWYDLNVKCTLIGSSAVAVARPRMSNEETLAGLVKLTSPATDDENEKKCTCVLSVQHWEQGCIGFNIPDTSKHTCTQFWICFSKLKMYNPMILIKIHSAFPRAHQMVDLGQWYHFPSRHPPQTLLTLQTLHFSNHHTVLVEIKPVSGALEIKTCFSQTIWRSNLK